MSENEVGDLVVESALKVHTALGPGLRLSKLKLGYLLNFNVTRMRDGIRRVVNGL